GAGFAGTKEISDLHAEDQSAFGDAAAAKLQAQIDNQANKNEVVDQLFGSTDFSNSIVRAMVQGFQFSKDVDSFAGTAQKYFDRILDIWQTRDFQNAETLAKQLYPFQSVTPETLQIGETWLLEHPTAPRALVRLIEENIFITRRALKVQASRRPQ
ncbi:MAG: hypothetical protein LBC43_00655, partial [Bifidobacteriaceae bacterium]|nr:hypothetical protein [Bifidobacteriaceae bacterium]